MSIVGIRFRNKQKKEAARVHPQYMDAGEESKINTPDRRQGYVGVLRFDSEASVWKAAEK